VTGEISYLQSLASLAGVVGLALAAGGLLAWLRGRAAVGRGPDRLRLIEQRPLDARNRLVLVRCDATELLIVLGPQGARQIALTTSRNEGDPR
jgi:flagellar biogenesis protein FliO